MPRFIQLSIYQSRYYHVARTLRLAMPGIVILVAAIHADLKQQVSGITQPVCVATAALWRTRERKPQTHCLRASGR